MRLSRSLSVIVWLVPVYGLDFIGVALGFELSKPEVNLLVAFIIAWCNDEQI